MNAGTDAKPETLLGTPARREQLFLRVSLSSGRPPFISPVRPRGRGRCDGFQPLKAAEGSGEPHHGAHQRRVVSVRGGRVKVDLERRCREKYLFLRESAKFVMKDLREQLGERMRAVLNRGVFWTSGPALLDLSSLWPLPGVQTQVCRGLQDGRCQLAPLSAEGAPTGSLLNSDCLPGG